jgi:hypothetical protein
VCPASGRTGRRNRVRSDGGFPSCMGANLLKEDPYMAAIAGAGDLAIRRRALLLAGFVL